MQLTAGIVNYGTYDDVLACVESLRRSSRPPDRIVVADNSSDPAGAARLCKELGAENVLASPHNRGYAGGGNAIIRAARDSDFILILNPDVRVSPGFCSELLSAAREEPRSAALAGKLLRSDGKTLDSAGVVVTRMGQSRDRAGGTPDDGRFDRREEVFGACGAAIFLRREALEDLCLDGEYFDEDFLIYHEDVDLCWRARLLGWKVVYVPTAVAFHNRGYKLGRRRGVARFVLGHSFKNHYLKLCKNLLPGQMWRDGAHLAAWEILRLGYAVLREPSLLAAYARAIRLLPRALRKRRQIMKRRRAGYSELARWFR